MTVGDQDEWLDEESTITELNGSFIIKTTNENHRQIEKLLVSLRRNQLERFEKAAKTVEVISLLKKADALRLSGNHRSSLEKIDVALRIDPACDEAKILRDIVNRSLAE